jgi:hypothetical protein
MKTDKSSTIKSEARAKIARLMRSPKYRTLFNDEAIQAFRKVKGGVFAGRPDESL